MIQTKIEAKARLSATPVEAVALTNKKRYQLVLEIVKRAKLSDLGFRRSVDTLSFVRPSASPEIYKKLMSALKGLGWSKPYQRGDRVGVTRADGTWPVLIKWFPNTGYLSIMADVYDTADGASNTKSLQDAKTKLRTILGDLELQALRVQKDSTDAFVKLYAYVQPNELTYKGVLKYLGKKTQLEVVEGRFGVIEAHDSTGCFVFNFGPKKDLLRVVGYRFE